MLGALWRRGPLSFASLIDEVKLAQSWGDATVKTLLGRLMRKAMIASKREDGRQLYHPMVTRTAYVDDQIQALADRLFDGKIEGLIAHLAGRQI